MTQSIRGKSAERAVPTEEDRGTDVRLVHEENAQNPKLPARPDDDLSREADSADRATPETIAALDQDIKQAQDQLTTLKAEDKRVRSELVEFGSRPLLSELRADVARLQKEKEEILAGLASLGEDESAMSPEEQQAVEKEWKYWQRQAHGRRRICNELWERCSEVVPEDMTREELKVRLRWTALGRESLGLEGPLA
ncbi:TBP interacting domain protein, partial [Aspergillus sp. HF37]